MFPVQEQKGKLSQTLILESECHCIRKDLCEEEDKNEVGKRQASSLVTTFISAILCYKVKGEK